MKVIELDGKNFKDVEFVHNILKIKLELPQYYGNNLDALWDCLTGWIEIPVAIRWNNYDESYMQLGEYAEQLKYMFEEAAKQMDGFTFELIE